MTEAVKEQRVGDKFKIGDKIEFVEKVGQAVVGDTAVVTSITDSWLGQYVHYKLDKNGTESDCYPERVKKVEPFTFKDIQKGDTIRRTKKYKSGATEVREGVAKVQFRDYWAEADKQFILAYSPTSEQGDITYELLDRPKPKHWLDTQPVGAIGLFGLGRYKKVLKKTEEDLWEVSFVVTNRTYKLSSQQCREQWPSLHYDTDEKIEWLS